MVLINAGGNGIMKLYQKVNSKTAPNTVWPAFLFYLQFTSAAAVG
jgi:hypothetical protein